MLSIIVPVYNEEANTPILYQRLTDALTGLQRPFEILFVNDGSTDRTARILAGLAARDSRVKVINFRRNFGQTAALMAGIDFATGEFIIPMDGDLQNDPADIPRLLAKLDEGYDVVSGWRKERKDPALRRKLPSWLANKLISKLTGVRLNDYGCSLKAYRRDVLKGVKLYGEMHRFIPIYAHWQGARVTEVPVNHFARIHGQSKYGLSRVIKVVLDLIVVKFLAKYQTKPIYIFGGFGMVNIAIAFLVGLYCIYLKLFEGTSFIRTPLPLLVVMTFITGILGILMGLLAELITRTYFESQGKPVYLIKDTMNLDGDGEPGMAKVA
jgi:dolichol-phosphate mannosyltransferase